MRNIKSELCQQITRSLFFPPFCPVMVVMRNFLSRPCLEKKMMSHTHVLLLLLLTIWGVLKTAKSCVTQPILMGFFLHLARFSTSTVNWHLTLAVNLPNAQTRGGVGTLCYVSPCYAISYAQDQNGTCHVQLTAVAYGTYSELWQMLCPPNGSGPS